MENENPLQTNEKQIQTRPGSIPIDRETVIQLKEQRAVLLEYVSSQLKKGSDYGIIPGTNKPTLFKPGAEKLRTLFNLTIRLDQEYRELDRKENFALFCYKATVFHNDVVISECEGSCNSQEKKYKERKEWNYCQNAMKKVPTIVETPVCDILNTLQKMAQKRAFVGAILLAVGASDFFNQDFDDYSDAQTIGVVPTDNKTVSNTPEIKNVSDKPVINHDDLFVVEAMTSYEERDLPKAAGFRWDKETKKWTKEMNGYEFESFSEFKIARL